jgi:nitroimidazol reductase NimA-like FMN-containing flavoprotein (pyridoxamine 5'-phosphate oxidase superfamily)
MFGPLAEQEARGLLQNSRVGRLGCVVDGKPYIVPINYYFEDDYIYSHSLAGLKISALRKTPDACLQVDEIFDDFHWRSVLAFGRYEEIENAQDRKRILSDLLTKFPRLTPVESVIASDAEPISVVVYRIRLERITGVAEE